MRKVTLKVEEIHNTRKISSIGISGKICAGKDMLCDYLISQINNNIDKMQGFCARKLAFADRLKQLCQNAWLVRNNLTTPAAIDIVTFLDEMYNMTHGDTKPFIKLLIYDLIMRCFQDYAPYSEDEKPRRVLQIVATDICRNLISQDIWVKLFLNQIKPGQIIVCSDLRFKSEALALRETGFILIRINADYRIRNIRHNNKYGFDLSREEHQSEFDLDYWTGWDYVLENQNNNKEIWNHSRNIVSIQEILKQIICGR